MTRKNDSSAESLDVHPSTHVSEEEGVNFYRIIRHTRTDIDAHTVFAGYTSGEHEQGHPCSSERSGYWFIELGEY